MRSPPGRLVGPRRPHHGIAAIVAAAKKQGRHASGNHLRMASGGPMHQYFVGSVRRGSYCTLSAIRLGGGHFTLDAMLTPIPLRVERTWVPSGRVTFSRPHGNPPCTPRAPQPFAGKHHVGALRLGGHGTSRKSAHEKAWLSALVGVAAAWPILVGVVWPRIATFTLVFIPLPH